MVSNPTRVRDFFSFSVWWAHFLARAIAQKVLTLISDPCTVFNEYSTNPVINKSVLSVSEEDFVSHQSVVLIRNKSFDIDFSFDPICDKQITDLLIKLDVKKSCGPDGFSPKLLQIAAPAIAAPLAKLFNCCIESCMWPTQWKISCVTPVYKKEDETNKKNYRPISVLSVIPKLFEKIMFEQTKHFHLSSRAICLVFFMDIPAVRLYRN